MARATGAGLEVGRRIRVKGKGKCAVGTLIKPPEAGLLYVEYRCDFHKGYHIALIKDVTLIRKTKYKGEKNAGK